MEQYIELYYDLLPFANIFYLILPDLFPEASAKYT